MCAVFFDTFGFDRFSLAEVTVKSSGFSRLMPLRNLEEKRCPSCPQGGNSPNNGLICLLSPVTLYSTFSGLLWQETTKTVLANTDNTCSSLYVHPFAVRIALRIQ